MAFTQSLGAGVQQAWLSFLDNDNIAIGNNTTSIAAGQIRPFYPFVGIQEMPTSILEGETVPVPGDDTNLGNFIFASADPREFLMNFGQGDLGLDALLQGTLVEALGDINIGLGDPGNPVYPTVCLIVNSRAIKRNPGTSGQAAWSGFIFPVVQIQPLNRETLTGRTAGVQRYKGVAQAAYNHPWGVTIAEAVNGDVSSFSFPFNSPYPLTGDAFKGDGIVTNWVLNKTPVNTNNTKAFVERVAATVNTVTPATKTATISTPVASNGRGVFIYGYSG
jgi:hypothetical protein